MKRSVLVLRYVFAALSVMIMVLIFYFSSQDGSQSGELSGSFATFLQSVFDDLHMSAAGSFLISYIRKFAHVSIYAALGLSVSICVFTFDFRHKWLWILLPAAICFVYACSDEFHQTFINGRDGKFTDVLIDSIGFLITIFLANIVYFFINRRSKPKVNGELNEIN